LSERSGAGRAAAVFVCIGLTAAAYAACVVAVATGGINTLFGLLPVFAGVVVGTCVILALATLTDAPRRLIRERDTRVDGVNLDALDDGELRALAGRVDLVEQLERRLAHGGRRLRRVAAASALGRVGSRTSLAPLSAALTDPDREVAYAAAQALARYDDPHAYQALLDALGGGDGLPGARVVALLEEFRPATATVMIERRASSDDSEVRHWVAYLLGRLADPSSAPVVEALSHDPDEGVRATAAEALGSFADADALGRLLSDDSWVVRCHAAKAVGKARLAALAPRLAELLEDRSWWVRQNSALALAELGESAVEVLRPQLRSHDRFARNKAAEVLVRTGYAARRIAELDTPNGDALGARRFLVDLGRAEAAGTIEAAFRDAHSGTRRAGLRAVLDEIGASAR
jgi:HEAT repeat protein